MDLKIEAGPTVDLSMWIFCGGKWLCYVHTQEELAQRQEEHASEVAGLQQELDQARAQVQTLHQALHTGQCEQEQLEATILSLHRACQVSFNRVLPASIHNSALQ